VGRYDIWTSADESSSKVRIKIQDFFESATPDDNHFIIFSGHGMKDRWGKLYFATADTDIDKVSATSLEMRFVIEHMNDSSARQQILFLDMCYSGAFQKGLVNKSAMQVISSDDFSVDDTNGTAIVTATTSVQLAGEAKAGGMIQSVFTRHIIEGIATGGADPQETGLITLAQLFQYVRAGVKREAPGQSPQPFYFGLDGSVVIALNPQPREATLPESIRAQIASKDRLQRLAAIDDILALGIAHTRLKRAATLALEGLEQDDSYSVRELATRARRKLANTRDSDHPAPETILADEISDLEKAKSDHLAQENAEADRLAREAAEARAAAEKAAGDQAKAQRAISRTIRLEEKARALGRWVSNYLSQPSSRFVIRTTALILLFLSTDFFVIFYIRRLDNTVTHLMIYISALCLAISSVELLVRSVKIRLTLLCFPMLILFLAPIIIELIALNGYIGNRKDLDDRNTLSFAIMTFLSCLPYSLLSVLIMYRGRSMDRPK
jgi:hypothetical protein